VTATPSFTPTLPPPPTFTFVPPTATPAGPPTVAPLDDGSGNLVPGTGKEEHVLNPVPGVDALPEPLVYLSDHGDGTGILQVWRLRYGLAAPEQLTFDAKGVAAFDVAPGGSLAYLTPDGEMVIDGVPFALPASPEGTVPQVTALAWSPSGAWLAYVLLTDEGTGPAPSPSDGLYLRSADGRTFLLSATVNADDGTQRVYWGPLGWRPDESEVLAGTQVAGGMQYSRVKIVSGEVIPAWNESILPPDAVSGARWNINGNAIIVTSGDRALRIEPDTLSVQTLVSEQTGLSRLNNAQQAANGTVTFSAQDSQGSAHVYLIPPGQTAPLPITDPFAPSGYGLDFLWDNFGQQALIVVSDSPGALPGTAYLRDEAGTLHDLTASLGPVGSPRWGMLFKPGETARVQTTEGDTLNLRAEPNGQVVTQLANGTRVIILAGPRASDEYSWWKVQTAEGLGGWAAESVTDESGLRLRTLVPTR
jgi:hypothetical protein